MAPGDGSRKRAMPPMAGGCQCGAVRYRILGSPLTLYCCHCTECQRQSSSAFGMSMRVERPAIEVEWRSMSCHVRGEGGRQAVEGWFCGRCGVRLFHSRPGASDFANVKAGSLDDTSWLRPVGHIWLASAQPWFVAPPGLLTCEGQPDDFAPFIRAWDRQQSGKEDRNAT